MTVKDNVPCACAMNRDLKRGGVTAMTLAEVKCFIGVPN